MKKFFGLIMVVAVFLTACASGMSDKPAATGGSLEIYQPMAMAAKTGEVTGAFLRIQNTGGQADRLVGASSDVAEVVQVHETIVENEIMSMREVAAIEIAPGESVELKHGGYHIMLIDLKTDLKAGEMFTLTLKFEKAGNLPVSVMVMKK
jgi:periplasmic copper chaperone A